MCFILCCTRLLAGEPLDESLLLCGLPAFSLPTEPFPSIPLLHAEGDPFQGLLLACDCPATLSGTLVVLLLRALKGLPELISSEPGSFVESF